FVYQQGGGVPASKTAESQTPEGMGVARSVDSIWLGPSISLQNFPAEAVELYQTR
ncbi:hypothetical protein J6590_101258, partial [Homalodisca vitripennis]